MKRLIFGVLLLMGAVSAWAGGFASLRMGADPRSGALGLAGTAGLYDASGIFWNPAGAAHVSGTDLVLAHHAWFQDVRGSFLGFARGNGRQGWGVNLFYSEISGFEQRTRPSAEPLSTFSTYEAAAAFIYARQVAPGLTVGATLKMMYAKLFTETATGGGLDFGAIYQIEPLGLDIGAAVQHLGKTGTLLDEEMDMPVIFRGGVSKTATIMGVGARFLVDAVKEKDADLHLHTGVEAALYQKLFLRLGYRSGYDMWGISGGVGFFFNGYRFEYAYTPNGDGWGDSHRMALGVSL